MKLFVFNYLNGLTNSWHNGWGLIVVAKSLAGAKKINPNIGDAKPDKVFELDEKHEKDASYSMIFPDAGCC